MNEIVIDQIKFENFRQYGTGSIKFSNTNKHRLSILVARNGTGKTTFLNAITWCLYGKEFQLSDLDKSLPIINTKVLADADDRQMVVVRVIITVLDGDKVLEFNRSQKIIVHKNSNDLNFVVPDKSNLDVSVTQLNFNNTDVISGPDTDFLVKQYFHDDIYDFYFFDGEKIKEFFAPGRENDIKKSIYNVSQVTLLKNVCAHVSALYDDNVRSLGKESPDIGALYIRQKEQEEKIQFWENGHKTVTADIEKLIAERTEKDEELKKYEPIKKLQNERNDLEKESKAIESEKKQFNSDRSSFIRKYTILLNMYPRIKTILAYIEKKELNGELPPRIDPNLVKALLANLDQSCPLCANDNIGEKGKKHLEDILTKLNVSPKTSNFLIEIKGSLENASIDVKLYNKRKDELNQREKDIANRENKVNKRLDEISQILIRYEEQDDEKKYISDLEKRRKDIDSELAACYKSLGASEQNIPIYKTQLNNINKQIAEAQSKLDKCSEIKSQQKVLSMMKLNYNNVLNKITSGMRSEIEETTRSIFESMNWKENTFGKINIDENYAISVFNKEGLHMLGSLSATEQMALAYAFILAIHQASGRNCPLVIDSPVGRSSDTNREDIAEALLKVSENKQIILLFTPDDFTAPIQKIYDNNVDIRKLKLSSDEKYVEGIDE